MDGTYCLKCGEELFSEKRFPDFVTCLDCGAKFEVEWETMNIDDDMCAILTKVDNDD